VGDTHTAQQKDSFATGVGDARTANLKIVHSFKKIYTIFYRNKK